MLSATTKKTGRRTLIVCTVAALIVFLAVLVFVFPGFGKAPASSEAAPPTVTENGFEVERDGVKVLGGADVAPLGTEVQVELIASAIPGEFGTFATPVTPVVDVTLGSGLQPASPITLIFSFTEEEVRTLDSDRLFVLGESAEEGRDVDFIESTWDPNTRTMTAQLHHLSWYTVTAVDDQALGAQMGKWIDQQMSTRTAKPACVDRPTQLSGSYVLATPWPDAAWVCADETETTVTIDLQSNSGLVYQILSEPDGEYAPLAALNPSGILTALIANRVEGDWNALEGDAVLLAGGNMEITFEKPFDSADIALKIEPGLSQVSSIFFGTSMLLPARMQEALDWYECGASGLESLAGSALGPTMLSCLSAGVKGVAGGLLSLIATGPGLVATQLEGAKRTLDGTDVEGFTVSLVAPDAMREPPAGATWLFERTIGGTSTSGDEEVASLPQGGATTASYPFSTNLWVSCSNKPAEGIFALNGEWTSLSASLALQTHSPDGMTATIEIIGDGRVLFSGTTTRGFSTPVSDLDVTGVRQLTVTAITKDDCGSANKGYATLGQAYLK
jgi:hypothetical protein